MIQKELKNYVEDKIIPLYQKKDWAHQSWHLFKVIQKSLEQGKAQEINPNVIYLISAFHDIYNTKEQVDKEINQNTFLKNYFTKEEQQIIATTIQNQKKEPKTIYEKILKNAHIPSNFKEFFRSFLNTTLEEKPDISEKELLLKCLEKFEKWTPSSLILQEEKEYYATNSEQFIKMIRKITRQIKKEQNLSQEKYPIQKSYYSYDEYLKKKYHEKVFKVSLNANLSCPNYEHGHGCIFCSHKKSGDFAGNPKEDLMTQFNTIKQKLEKKWPTGKYIAYFQAGTNTYAPLSVLKEKYETVLNIPNVVGLAIATRSDAINEDVLTYLEELNQKTDLTIELGLQSIHSKTLTWIHRGHTLENFDQMVQELKKRNIKVVVHIINGLPTETKEDMLKTVKHLNQLQIDGIKIHMLHVLKNSPLGSIYEKQPFHLLTKEEYIDIVCDQLELLNSNIVIHRITGDPDPKELIAPSWLLKKFVVLNDLEKELQKRNSYQGKLTSNNTRNRKSF